MAPQHPTPQYVPLAEVEVDAVRPTRGGFTLDGHGADHADYRLEMTLDLPVDSRTRTILAELLSQSEWKILRRMRAPLLSSARRGDRLGQAKAPATGRGST